MPNQLMELVRRWIEWDRGDTREILDASVIELGLAEHGDPIRPPADPRTISAWESRHGYRLPTGLRQWLSLSNGLYRNGPLIHPISAIGPMVPFARIPNMLVQPESWFELGNPNIETVCIDLGYRWPNGGHPIYTSGDEVAGTTPKVIARSFREWFVKLLNHGGREYWFEPGFVDLGCPWEAHRKYAPAPLLPERLLPLADRLKPLMFRDADDRAIAKQLGISRTEVELLLRYMQHRSSDLATH